MTKNVPQEPQIWS